jgi:glycosyltransferase involved in cell wall biosynthesis
MRIALCLEYPIHQSGGTEVLVRELIYGLAPQYEIVLVSGDSSTILHDPLLSGKIAAHICWDPTAVNFQQSRRLALALKAAGVEFAHFHFGGNYAWGNRLFNVCPVIHLSRLDVPCLATNHGLFGVFDGYIGPQRSWLTKLALLPAAWMSKLQTLNHLKAEVAVSQNDYLALRRRYWPLRSRFRRIYHSRIYASSRLPDVAREKIVLCAGTVGPRKGQPYLARAFMRIASQFPDWKLVFVGRSGESSTSEDLRTLLKDPGLQGRTEWQTACSDEELTTWLQSAEVFAMPSMHEGLGLSLQEALFHGCACIATRIGGIPDLIQHYDNGILVERANVAALARGLSELMRDDHLRLRFRSRGRASVIEKQMTAAHMVANYLKLYREVL